jgi:Co/Zn/Cd efflux system component/copper chaperone CopZ
VTPAPPAARPGADDGATNGIVRHRVTGMDCANDAAAVERAVRQVAGVDAVRVSAATQIMTAHLNNPAAFPDVEQAVAGLGYHLEPLDGAARGEGAAGDDDLPLDPRSAPPGYIRALWVVVALNLGYGVIEAVGGFLSGSQALKADALDFIGDGLVTTVAALAVRWSLAARARVALAQGLFLFALGLGVLGNTAWRLLAATPPEAEMMGVFGAVALVVNVAAAVVLLPYRAGHDASARAVWRFSAADAAGNFATVVAAGLVAWLSTPWPDLVVAIAVAGLFLRSAWAIIRDARADLREAHGDAPALA